MVGKPGMKWTTPEQIAEARRLRATGMDYDQLQEATGMQRASLHRYVKDVPIPVTPKKAAKSVSKYDRDQRRQTMADHAKPMYATSDDEDDDQGGRWLPDSLPANADGYDMTGLFPDDRLVAWASGVEQRFIDDKAKGVIFHGVPAEVIKAQIITSTLMRPWDDDWMRKHREHWNAIRLFTTLNSATVAGRAGISASSFTRYSNGTRTPLKPDFEKISSVLWEAMQHRLYNLDLWLCLEDFVAAHGLDREDPYEMDEALRWISGIGPNDEHWDDEATLEHLPSLSHVRSLMPVPDYRDEDTMLFGYLGFAQPADAAAIA